METVDKVVMATHTNSRGAAAKTKSVITQEDVSASCQRLECQGHGGSRDAWNVYSFYTFSQ